METSYRVVELLKSALGTEVSVLLADPTISEIRLNSDGALWANKLGKGKFDTGAKISPENARRAIEAVAYSVHECCNEQKPSISAELPVTGERFQGVLPPLSKGPVIAIRKKAVKIYSLLELENQGVIAPGARDILRRALFEKKNILVVGGTDSGKTTFANALLREIGETQDRILIIEDTQELQCQGEDVEYLRTRDGVASLRDLVRVTMRLSPDRIVIGEVRGPEALDLIKAWNTGHGGGVSTVHANSARQGLSRIEQLIEEAGVTASRPMIAEAINILVYMEKVGTTRKVKGMLEVSAIQHDQYELTPLG